VLTVIPRTKKQDWITDEILNLMEKRKTRRRSEAYNKLNKKVRQECRKAIQFYMKQYEEFEQLEKVNPQKCMIR